MSSEVYEAYQKVKRDNETAMAEYGFSDGQEVVTRDGFKGILRIGLSLALEMTPQEFERFNGKPFDRPALSIHVPIELHNLIEAPR
jgi:hypothetical protein